MTSEVIVTDKLNKIYGIGDIQVHALKDVSISISKGEYIAIMGPSGSGKSTFMNLIGCLDTPTSGKLFIGGTDVSELQESQLSQIRREQIGFIFQKYNLISTLNALENVELSMSFNGVRTKERMQRAEELLGMVDLLKRKKHKPSELSGGEQQRVAIARALANNPSIVLADEPTGNVDTTGGDKIMEILGDINRKGETVIVVTHDPRIAQHARRVLLIQDGMVREGNV
jgi:putative ABC transport system ATP-binding protein